MDFVAEAAAAAAGARDRAQLQRASVFELAAERAMRDLLRPALAAAAQAALGPAAIVRLAPPRLRRWLLARGSAAAAAAALAAALAALELHHLRRWGASFSETFYGLRRAPLRSSASTAPATASRRRQPRDLGAHQQQRDVDADPDRLTPAQLWGSLLYLALGPVVESSLQQAYDAAVAESTSLFADDDAGDRLGDGHDGGAPPHQQPPLSARLAGAARRWLVAVYPLVQAVVRAALLANQLAYMFGVVDFHSPEMALLGLRVRRMGPDDF
ncbi:ubiquitin-protein ligase peroxin 12, partial [Cladochytrium tenue]